MAGFHRIFQASDGLENLGKSGKSEVSFLQGDRWDQAIRLGIERVGCLDFTPAPSVHMLVTLLVGNLWATF